MSLLPFPDRSDIDTNYQYDDIYDFIGKGTFATVFKAVCIKDVEQARKDQVVALKIFSRKDIRSDKTLHDIINESEILHHLNHPRCVKLLDCFQTPSQVVLVMDLVNGKELFHAMKERSFTETMVRSIMHQLFEVLTYLHDTLNIVHRDIKPENILAVADGDHDYLITLVDFGLSRKVNCQHNIRRPGRGVFMPPTRATRPASYTRVSDVHGTNSPLQATPCGTLKYAAPEVIKSINQSGQLCTTRDLLPRVDVYAAGMIMYIMLFGTFPFKDFSNKSSLLREMEEGPSFASTLCTDLSVDAIDLLKTLLVMDPDKRPRADEALRHAWFHRNLTQNMADNGAGNCAPVDEMVGNRDLMMQAFNAIAPTQKIGGVNESYPDMQYARPQSGNRLKYFNVVSS